MVDVWHLSLAVGAVASLAMSYKVPRAWIWILSLAASFVASDLYQSAGMPHGPVFVALCDVSVCLLIDRLAREKYEVLLFNLMRFSVLVSVVQFGATTIFKVENHYSYVVILECVNWLALALIGGIGLHQIAGGHDRNALSRRAGSNILRSIDYLRQARRKTSWLHR